MSDDAISAINKGETILILAAVAIGGYLIYEFYSDIQDFINNLFGVKEGAGSYTNAAAQTVAHPITTLETILGVGPYGRQGSRSDWNENLQLCTGDTVGELIDQGYSDDQIAKVITTCNAKGQPPKTVAP